MKLLMLDDEEISKKENYLLSNSEWRVKVVGSQSCMRLGGFKAWPEGPETGSCWGKKYWGRDLVLRLVSSLVEYD
jgi:hypothetical protein